jgi:PAS domain S-box-containing protein
MLQRHGARRTSVNDARVRDDLSFSDLERRLAGGTAELLEQLTLERERLTATRNALMDPHVMFAAVRDPDGTIVDFVFVDANDAAIAYNHSTREEMIGARLLSILPGHLHSGVFATYVHAVETGEPLILDDSTYFNEIWGSERHCDVRAVKVGDGLSYTWRDVTDRVELSQKFRLLAENSSDVVFETNLQGEIRWVSPSVTDVLGWRPHELVGVRSNDLITDEDLARADQWRRAVYAGEAVTTATLQVKTSTGDLRWMAVRIQPARNTTGEVTGGVVGLRDCQSEVVAQRAARTLSAGSQVLVRSECENDLLLQMCQAAVDEGGYLLAWYGRRIPDESHRVEKVAMSSNHHDYVESIEVDWSTGPLGRGPVGTAMRTGETVVIDDLTADSTFSPWRASSSRHGFRSCIALPVHVDGVVDGTLQVYAAEPSAFNEHVVDVLDDLASELGYGLKRLRDHERLLQSLKDQTLLSKAIDQASESIVVTDPDSVILYANPSSLRTSGYDLAEVLGRTPSLFGSELHDHSFFRVMWAHLLGGQAWHGTLINRRKNGELYEEDTTISPIHDAEGRLLAYVAVKRDLTVERRLETNRTREQRDRLDILDLMQDVRRAPSLEATAEAFCHAATKLDSIDGALVVLVQGDSTLLTVGAAGERFADARSGEILGVEGPEGLIERTSTGAWWLDVTAPESNVPGSFTRGLVEMGIATVANVPIRWEGQLVGILALASKDPDGPSWMNSRLAAFEELGSYAGALFGAEAEVFSARESMRSRVLTIMRERRFRPVFQPFVELETGRVVGYEALTRFDDDENPQQRFMQAHSVGLGSELESLCASVALEAASALSKDVWLSINFSPAALIDGHAADVVSHVDRQLVIEITEHAQIKNYAAIRRALGEIDGCRIAVDDAGAGYTSLSHILELQPDFVKLDISLVRDIDTNPARQAMIAGMCHFAAQSGTTLIAEGIETEAEAKMLRELGVPLGEGGMLGQGYFFGRPTNFDERPGVTFEDVWPLGATSTDDLDVPPDFVSAGTPAHH